MQTSSLCDFPSTQYAMIYLTPRTDDGSLTAFLMGNSDKFDGNQLVLIANALVSVSVLFTYPLQLFPALSLVGRLWARAKLGAFMNDNRGIHVQQNNPADDCNGAGFTQLTCGGGDVRLEDSQCDLSRDELSSPSAATKGSFEGDSLAMRMSLVVLTYVIAMVVPNVQELISLAGALAGSSIALIIPPMLEIKYIPHSHSSHLLSTVRCYIMLSVGVIFMMIGTVASIRDIIIESSS